MILRGSQITTNHDVNLSRDPNRPEWVRVEGVEHTERGATRFRARGVVYSLSSTHGTVAAREAQGADR